MEGIHSQTLKRNRNGILKDVQVTQEKTRERKGRNKNRENKTKRQT